MNFVHLTKDKCGLIYEKNFARELSGTINCIKMFKPTKLIEKSFDIQRTVHRDIQ
jgi:hypothetical protein